MYIITAGRRPPAAALPGLPPPRPALNPPPPGPGPWCRPPQAEKNNQSEWASGWGGAGPKDPGSSEQWSIELASMELCQ